LVRSISKWRNTDQPINRSTDQPINRSNLIAIGAMSMFLLLSGTSGYLGPHEAVSTHARTAELGLVPAPIQPPQVSQFQIDTRTNTPITVDVGIIFSDRSNYLCLPTERLGVSRSAKIVSVSTSCQCVQARVVEIGYGQIDESLAILFEFVAATVTSNQKDNTASQLDIEVSLRLADGSSHGFSLRVLEVNGYPPAMQ
jgi:hypothetical protein